MMHKRGTGRLGPWNAPTSARRFFGGVLAFPALLSCSALYLQTDGFRGKLGHGCSTEEQCKKLVDEATKRLDKCEPNTIGSIRCEDATADLQKARELLATVKTPVDAKPTASRDVSPPAAMVRDDTGPTREEQGKELNDRNQARDTTERQRRSELDEETRSGRCTDGHAETLRRVLDQVVGFWRDEPLQVVSHKLVVLSVAGIGLEMPVVFPGEYHVFVIQPDGRAPQLMVYDGDGYEVKQGSEWGGYFSAGGTGIGGRSRRLQWSDPTRPILLKAAGEGCAMAVLVHRIW